MRSNAGNCRNVQSIREDRNVRMAEYDALPLMVRAALQQTAFNSSTSELRSAVRQHGANKTAELITYYSRLTFREWFKVEIGEAYD